MCNFFTCIVTTSGDVLFTEEDSHDTVIERYGAIDNLKSFIRMEYTPIIGYIIDEKSIPEWYERILTKAEEEVKATYKKVVTTHRVMTKTRRRALRAYRSSCREIARNKMAYNYNDWDECRNRSWVKYMKIKRKGIAEYKAKIKNVEGYVCERG